MGFPTPVVPPMTSAFSPCSGKLCISAEADRLQIIVCLDDFDEAILGRAVAAIGVRMMPLHEFMEARLDFEPCCTEFQTERIEGLALGIADGTAFRLPGGSRIRASMPAQFAEQRKRIDAILGIEFSRVFVFSRSHFPGRA